MNLAPIALFTYNRLWHTKQTVEALRGNTLAALSDLFIFSDGPKSINDQEKVTDVRNYLSTVTGFRSVTITQRPENHGLARSIIDGVTEIVSTCGRIIVLEDDLVTSPLFLQFMNASLEEYANNERVISIHGYVYPVKADLPQTFFLRGADCWGWATWERGWKLFEPDGRKLLKELRRLDLTDYFDFDNAYPFTKQLADQIKGKNNSWAIRWHASAFLHDRLTLYPGRSLVQNIGNDGSGVHCESRQEYAVELSDEIGTPLRVPLEENLHARMLIGHFLRSVRPSLRKRVHKFFSGIKQRAVPLLKHNS